MRFWKASNGIHFHLHSRDGAGRATPFDTSSGIKILRGSGLKLLSMPVVSAAGRSITFGREVDKHLRSCRSRGALNRNLSSLLALQDGEGA